MSSSLTELPSPGSRLVHTILSIALAPDHRPPHSGDLLETALRRIGVEVTHCPWPEVVSTSVPSWCWHLWIFFSHSTGDFPVSWYDEWFSTVSWRFGVSRRRGHVILEMPEGTKQCPCHTSHGRLLSDVTDLPWLSQGQTYQSSRKIFKDARSQSKDNLFFPSNGCQLL